MALPLRYVSRIYHSVGRINILAVYVSTVVPSTRMGHSEKASGYGYMCVQALNVCIEQFSLISHMTRRLSFTFMVHRSLKVEEPRSVARNYPETCDS